MGMPSATELLIILALMIVFIFPIVLFFNSQVKLAKKMRTSDLEMNTGSGWIWTQIIPIWSLVAVPVTLMKLDQQFRVYIEENNLSPVVKYNNLWGWIWYGGTVASIIIPLAGLIALVGFVGFWIHIVKVREGLEFLS